jgi:DNA-binding CsgD family transcriptional regulator
VLVAETHGSHGTGACAAVRLEPRLQLVDCVSNAVAKAVELTPSVCVLDSDLPLGGLTAPTARLLRTIVNVAAGEAVLSGTQVARVLEAVRDPARARRRVAGKPAFTVREWQVLELLRNRLSTAEIAERLVLSPITVRSHTQSIRQKLSASGQDESARPDLTPPILTAARPRPRARSRALRPSRGRGRDQRPR